MAPHRVVAVVLDTVHPLDLAAPAHFFGYLGVPRYEFALAGEQPGPIRSSSGFDVVVEHGVGAIEEADTVIVPGYAAIERRPPDPVLEAMRAAAAKGARMTSICAGAFALAHAGLLDGRRVTTHWHIAGDLASLFPALDVDPDVLFVDEGDVLTSAGFASGLDLCLHVVRQDHGAKLATALARLTVIAPHRDGGQAQFIDLPVPPPVEGSPELSATRAWALENLGERLDVSTLAAHAMVSPRTFARRFRAETGTTPHRWVLHQRILEARRLLESTEMPIEDVATACGFGSAASLRSHFHRQTGTSPTAYRRTFAGPSRP
jgi:AraC family transcriptional regulator, transcriptional activator FtrA